MAEGSGEYKYTVDIRSIPQEPRGVAKVVPTRIRARFGSKHVAYGDSHMDEEQAKRKVSSIVDTFRVMHGNPNERYFGKVVEKKTR
jgi:hypothetical protein